MTDDRQLPIQPDPGPSAEPEPARPTGAPASGRRPNPPLPPPTRREPSSADVAPRRPDYRGEELDPERGPGLGCFWFQVIVLAFFIVIIPVGLNLNWPFEVLAILLFVVIGLLLLTGQTVIFLLRIVAADRRSTGRRRPLASATKTVGEIEDELGAAPEPAGEPERPEAASAAAEPAAAEPAGPADEPPAEDPPAAAELAGPAEGPPAAAEPAGPADEPPAEGPPAAEQLAEGPPAAEPPAVAADPDAADPAAEPDEPSPPEEADPGVRQ